jgi:hypothetical protein
MAERILYHTTSRQGIETFYPKPYWHRPDFFASGVVKADTQIPEGAVRADLFFAQGSEKIWYWFSPKDVIKSMLLLGSRRDVRLALRLPEDCKAGCVVFDIREKDWLERLSMSTYEFDARQFRHAMGDEYVTDKPVCPIRETRWTNVIDKTRRYGVHVLFVDDIHSFLAESRAGGFSTHRIVSHLQPTEDKPT